MVERYKEQVLHGTGMCNACSGDILKGSTCVVEISPEHFLHFHIVCAKKRGIDTTQLKLKAEEKSIVNANIRSFMAHQGNNAQASYAGRDVPPGYVSSFAKEPDMATKQLTKPAPKGGKNASVAEPKPKKSATKIALTDEEMQAAISGKLKPRQITGDLNQESLTATGKNGRPVGRPLGRTLGLPIIATWIYLFQENEKRPKGEKWTDDELSSFMVEEFPGRETAYFKNGVNSTRRYVNSGLGTKGTPPTWQSRRYDTSGNVLEKVNKNTLPKSERSAAAPVKPPRTKEEAAAHDVNAAINKAAARFGKKKGA